MAPDDMVVGDKVRLNDKAIADLPFWGKVFSDVVLTVMEIHGDNVEAYTSPDKRNGYRGKKDCFVKVS